MRDDFSKPVVETLAKRVGNRCSNPACRKLTSGPHTDESKAVNVGIGGHITAASPGGPRYDPSLTPEQRRSADNGIWLCQTCGKLVDNDEVRFPATLLREWRQKAEDAARQEVESSQPPRIVQSFCIATHVGAHEIINPADCDRHGCPVAPPWLLTTPERMCSDWLVERFSSNADLRL